MMVFLCLSLCAVGTVQVQVWAACQDLGGEHSATVTGWTNLCGNLMSRRGPAVHRHPGRHRGDWVLALGILAVAGVLGAGCWFFVHPERPLVAPAVPATA